MDAQEVPLLMAQDGPLAGREFRLDRDVMTLGRGEECDCCRARSANLARSHARPARSDRIFPGRPGQQERDVCQWPPGAVGRTGAPAGRRRNPVSSVCADVVRRSRSDAATCRTRRTTRRYRAGCDWTRRSGECGLATTNFSRRSAWRNTGCSNCFAMRVGAWSAAKKSWLRCGRKPSKRECPSRRLTHWCAVCVTDWPSWAKITSTL